MNDKQAHSALKKLEAQRKAVGIGGYRDSRKDKVERHEKFNEAITEINKISDESKMKELRNE